MGHYALTCGPWPWLAENNENLLLLIPAIDSHPYRHHPHLSFKMPDDFIPLDESARLNTANTPVDAKFNAVDNDAPESAPVATGNQESTPFNAIEENSKIPLIPTAFNIFCDIMIEQLPPGITMTKRAAAKNFACSWLDTPPDLRTPFVDRAQVAQAEHKRRYPNYTAPKRLVLNHKHTTSPPPQVV